MTEPAPERVDFFVSYNHADQNWAEWVAWQLEEAGYTTRLQAWDFRPGANFVLEMQEAARFADRTIAILSPNYLGSQFTAPEWAAAFANDPAGRSRSLIPVRIAPSHADGLLGQIVWINLVGLSREKAKATLLAGLQPGRAKPLTEPPFPGSAPPGPSQARQASSPLTWQPLTDQPEVSWRSDLLGSSSQTPPARLELHLLPTEPLHLEVRRLDQLGDELASLGRNTGLFGAAQALTIQADGTRAYAVSQPSRTEDEAGLAVTRTGQRAAWLTLPHDSMGAAFDPDDVRPRLTALLGLLRTIPMPDPERTAFAVRIEPLMQLSITSAANVGHRTQSQLPFASRQACVVRPDDAVLTTALDAHVADIADELVARLNADLAHG